MVDLAHRISHIQYQSRHDRRKVRRFFIDHQDRILYGTDQIFATDADPVEFRQAAQKIWRTDWRYFCTDASMTVAEVEGAFQGLRLPKTVIDKIYRINAMKVFSNAFTHQASLADSGPGECGVSHPGNR